jgi:hypothetical protein
MVIASAPSSVPSGIAVRHPVDLTMQSISIYAYTYIVLAPVEGGSEAISNVQGRLGIWSNG